jgi:hypothetical protein
MKYVLCGLNQWSLFFLSTDSFLSILAFPKVSDVVEEVLSVVERDGWLGE